jgi:DNA-binding PadR family transcriptional regulator
VSGEQMILADLAEHGPSFGLDLVKRGVASRGSVYVELSRMQAEGLVDSWEAPGPTGLLRRMYRITAVGRRVLA